MVRAHVDPVLEVRSVEKSLEFYLRLGFRRKVGISPVPHGAAVEFAGARVVLVPAPRQAPEARGAGVVLHLAVPDPGPVRRAAEALGAVAGDWPAEGANGFRVEDPDGYVLAFTRERRRARPRPRRAERRKRRRRGK